VIDPKRASDPIPAVRNGRPVLLWHGYQRQGRRVTVVELWFPNPYASGMPLLAEPYPVLASSVFPSRHAARRWMARQ
jgi:hypothetical protein